VAIKIDLATKSENNPALYNKAGGSEGYEV
jgi:hypothetical protein